MIGTAIRTNAPPVSIGEDYGLVYAVWPRARYAWGATGFVLVVSSPRVGDICLFACSAEGAVHGPLLCWAETVEHDMALLELGYELEVASVAA